MRTDVSVFMRPDRSRRYFLVSFLLVCLASVPAQDQPVFEGHGGVGDAYRATKSTDGSYVIISNNRTEALGHSKWVAEVMSRLEKLLGKSFPYDHDNYFHVVLRDTQKAGSPEVDYEIVDRMLLQMKVKTVVLYDYYNLKRARAMEGLCELLMNSLLDERDPEKKFPAWFVVGVSQNLFPVDRERNRRHVYERWQSGDIVSVGATITSDKENIDVEACGALVEWLLSSLDKSSIVDKLIKTIDEGGGISKDWVSDLFSDVDSDVDIDEQWDYWLFSGKNTIHALGRLDTQLIAELQAELLIYSGVYGNTLDSNVGRVVTFRQLVEFKDEGWIPEVCSRKAAALQLLGLGKAREFSKVTELYCDFLNAVAQGKSAWRLNRMLNKADEALEKLESRAGI